MGCGGSKDNASSAAPDRRRRLSVTGDNEAGEDLQEAERGVVETGSMDTILELFPNSDRKFSITAQPAPTKQAGFENKKAQAAGNKLGAVGYACKKGLKPDAPNQDDFCILQVEDWGLYCVFDGHGPNGHNVSNHVQKALIPSLVRDPAMKTAPSKAFSTAFQQTHHSLERAFAKGSFDCQLSGCTATVTLVTADAVHCGWVGDSRAVLAERQANGTLLAKDLSEDHKPDKPEEKKRIQKSGGEVRLRPGDVPHRVFLRGKNFPGLAMSRAMGDFTGRLAGVISEPETRQETKSNMEFMLVCSDGVWEFITSQQAVDFVAKFKPEHAMEAAEALAQESWNRWMNEEGMSDDITCIVVWFDKDNHKPQ